MFSDRTCSAQLFFSLLSLDLAKLWLLPMSKTMNKTGEE